MRKFLSVLGLLSCLVLVPSVQASEQLETVSLANSNFTLHQGQMKTVSLEDGWHWVQKIYIQADGINKDGAFEVLANGDAKGTVYVPGSDPNYVVTIGETVRSLQFRHITGGNIRISAITSLQSVRVTNPSGSDPEHDLECIVSGGCEPGPYNPNVELPVKDEAGSIAKQTIQIVDRLEQWSDVNEYKEYLLPIKVAAARLYSIATVHNPHSSKLHLSLVTLKKQIEFATPFIEETFSKHNLFTLAVELQHVADRIELILI